MRNRFGEYLRRMRLSRRLSVTGASAMAGVSRRAWTAWESGLAEPHRPEAEAALLAVGVTGADAAAAITLIDAPWAVRERRGEATARLNLSTLPPTRSLLVTMRRRAGLTQEGVAAALRVRPSTIHRWESGLHALPEDRLETFLSVLRASPEERSALTQGGMSLGGRESALPDLAELEFRAMALCNDACHGQHTLMDLRFLSLESDLCRLAVRHTGARWTLAQVYSWHAMWLCWRGREAEAGPYGDSSLDMLRREFPKATGLGRPLHASLRSSVKRGVSRMEVIETLQGWIPSVTAPAHRAWMLRDLAELMSEAGYGDAAVQTSERAFAVALTLTDPYEIRCAQADRAEIFLRSGKFHQALESLPSRMEATAAVPAEIVRELRLSAEIHLALNDHAAAQAQLVEAYSVVNAYALAQHRPTLDLLSQRL